MTLLAGCTNTEPVEIEHPPLPRPPDAAIAVCPLGLPKAHDGTIQSVLDARSDTARQYALCRARHKALKSYIEDIRRSD